MVGPKVGQVIDAGPGCDARTGGCPGVALARCAVQGGLPKEGGASVKTRQRQIAGLSQQLLRQAGTQRFSTEVNTA